MKRATPQFLTFAKKEFTHVLRDRKTLLILFGLPIVQIIIFGFALTNEVKNSKVLIIDRARDVISAEIVSKIGASRYFELDPRSFTNEEIEEGFKHGRVKLAVVIPSGFGNDLLHFHQAPLQVIADASDPNTANTLTNYLSTIVSDYQQQKFSDPSMPLRISMEV